MDNTKHSFDNQDFIDSCHHLAVLLPTGVLAGCPYNRYFRCYRHPELQRGALRKSEGFSNQKKEDGAYREE
jgi:hypothetical protein